jgi:glycosyltransferase involved in cell wall biosynthesis
MRQQLTLKKSDTLLCDIFNMTEKIAVFVANRGFALYNSRLLLMRQLIDNNWKVVAVTSVDEYTEKLSENGITVKSIQINRGGVSPIRDLFTFLTLLRIYFREKPTLIHHFHAKPVILGTLAARLAQGKTVKVVNTITGLGHAFIKKGVSKYLASAGYHLVLKSSNCTIFQNQDDHKLFKKNNWITDNNSELIISSGVDISRFRNSKEPSFPPIILFVGRLIWQKGVREFIDAAKIVRQSFPGIRFQLAGEFDTKHPDAVPEDYIRKADNDEIIEFLGFCSNMEDIFSGITLFVLPSYREGVPRVILEAAACGVPSITSDTPGCRQAVIDGKTGVLVPLKNSTALARKICELVSTPNELKAMGIAARNRVLQEFDIKLITQKYMAVYERIRI